MKVLTSIKSVWKFLSRNHKKKVMSAFSLFLAHNLLDLRRIWILLVILYTSFSYRTLKQNDPQYALKLSFTRKISRIFGGLTRIKIPKVLRKTIFTFYSRAFKVRLNDIVDPLDSFETFGDFFTRKIHPRPVDNDPRVVVSPADSKVLCLSEVTKDECLIVKGIEYRLGELLTGINTYKVSDEVLQGMKKDPNNKLYQIVLYLSPGDYHRYHSPCDYHIKSRNHIVGKLLPVKEKYVKTHTDVYEKNERVSIFGEWPEGFMSMVFVGAMNVGSIVLNFDPELQTNLKLRMPFTNYQIKFYGEEDKKSAEEQDKAKLAQEAAYNVLKDERKGIEIAKGSEMGRFKMGSTIVLVFEAGPNFEWKVQPGDSLLYGQVLGISK